MPDGQRGFACIALDNPKSAENIGGAMRAASVFGAQMIVVGGKRVQNKSLRHSTDTMKFWRHNPLIVVDDVFDALPFDCVPIAVDLVDEAVPLTNFAHPQRGFYIFGAEDATLGSRTIDRCAHIVVIPTVDGRCLNLAASVNVILYDRLAKNLIRSSNHGIC